MSSREHPPESSRPDQASGSPGAGLRYKFVELSIVTDESIEEAVNTWVAQGWHLDGIRFVTSESSRRPVMAFISFVRDDTSE